MKNDQRKTGSLWSMLRGRSGRLFAVTGFALLFVLLTIGSGYIPAQAGAPSMTVKSAKPELSTMEVHFIDVGQGDATLIKCGDAAMLIDAGDDSKGTLIQNYLRKQGVEKLDYLILTHPDSDHIGGAPVIITKFKVDQVFMSDYEKDTKTYMKVIQALDDKRMTWTTPEVGSIHMLDTARFTIIGPGEKYDDPNNASVALILRNGSNKFLFSGDAEEAAEADILKTKIRLSADVYKVGHHGSKTASGSEFLEAINPAYAVISCAEGNSYGHPHAEPLNNLRARKVKVFRTDEQGSIIASSDGQNITWNCAPSDSWQVGEQNVKSAVKTPVPEPVIKTPESTDTTELSYVLNVKTKKFHLPSCSSLPTTNREDSGLSRESVIGQGYVPCKKCNP